MTRPKPEPLVGKLLKLTGILNQMESVLVAFSGGVDSTLLLKIATDTCPGRVLAVTARSPLRPRAELDAASQIVRSLGVEHRFLDLNELEHSDIVGNPPDRCYHCKHALFERLKLMADESSMTVIDGSNVDDLGEYRPGRRAMRELGIRSPFVEVGLNKVEIRLHSRVLGLPTWDAPAQSCLATRFPYGEILDPSKLCRVDEAEQYLRSLGFSQLRVRSHGSIARIEVGPDAMTDMVRQAQLIAEKLSDLGFEHITLDLRGFRSGSMDAGLKGKVIL